MFTGFVHIVGAGPGRPDLITVRGLSCLRRADAVLYDRLVSESLLAECRSDCELIYCGKEGAGHHAMVQEEICALLVSLALAGKRVCRLKGGDPMVFGRGGEEAAALSGAGIPFEIVPGVTAGVGATAYAGIPATFRGVSDSVTFLTGHEADGSTSAVDWSCLARSAATLICYMSLGRLARVQEQLIRHGRSPDTPAAVIHWRTRPEQQVVTAILAEVADRARLVPQPALVVIGDVISLRDVVSWVERLPLFGRRILLPFAGGKSVAWSERLRDLGAEPWLFPRRPDGPSEHEVALLLRALGAGGIHEILAPHTVALEQLCLALGGWASIDGITCNFAEDGVIEWLSTV